MLLVGSAVQVASAEILKNQPLTASEATGNVYTLTDDEKREVNLLSYEPNFYNKNAALASYDAFAKPNQPKDLTVALDGHNLTLNLTSNHANVATLYAGQKGSSTKVINLTIKDS